MPGLRWTNASRRDPRGSLPGPLLSACGQPAQQHEYFYGAELMTAETTARGCDSPAMWRDAIAARPRDAESRR
jgi:hypothetical protein